MGWATFRTARTAWTTRLDGPPDGPGCTVWLAHELHNYEECNNENSILHLLIPRTKDGLGNEQCTMFRPKEWDRRRQVR